MVKYLLGHRTRSRGSAVFEPNDVFTQLIQGTSNEDSVDSVGRLLEAAERPGIRCRVMDVGKGPGSFFGSPRRSWLPAEDGTYIGPRTLHQLSITPDI